MYLRGIIRDGEGKEVSLLSPFRSLIHHSLAVGGHLLSVVSGNPHGFLSLLVLGPEGTLNTIRRSERVSNSWAAYRFSRSTKR